MTVFKYLFFLIIICLSSPAYLSSQACSSVDTSFCFHKTTFELGDVAIEKKWATSFWASDIMNPVVCDIDDDCIPELIVASINGREIHIVDAKTGSILSTIDTPLFLNTTSSLAIADVDRDGDKEIFLVVLDNPSHDQAVNRKIICYNLDGTQKWISNETYKDVCRLPPAPGLADFNQDGIPELYVLNEIYNATTGVKLLDGGPHGDGVMNGSDALSVAANLDDDDSNLELAAGHTIYKISIINTNGTAGNTITPINIMVDNKYIDGPTTVADINGDGKLDVIVFEDRVSKRTLYAYYLDSGTPRLLFAQEFMENSNTGYTIPPTVGVIDDTGVPSIILHFGDTLFNLKYVLNDLELIWSEEMAFNEHNSSGLFDFNGDLINELIVFQSDSISIYDAKNGFLDLLTSDYCKKSSWRSKILVFNIGDSLGTSICVPCTDMTGVISRLTAFGAPDSSAWAPARNIWNQYNYQVLNVNDDGTIPQFMHNNATYNGGRYNNTFTQASLLDEEGRYPLPVANLTGDIVCVQYDPETQTYTVLFDLLNLPDASLDADSGLSVAFYDGDPETVGLLLGIYQSTSNIASGDQLLGLEFSFSESIAGPLFMVVNTEKSTIGAFENDDFMVQECDYTDNIAQAENLPILEYISEEICDGDDYEFYDLNVNTAGEYYHKLSNVDGCDSLIVTLELNIVDTINRFVSTAVCDTLIWDGIALVESGIYTSQSVSMTGCDSITFLDLTVYPSTNSTLEISACDSFVWNGTTYTESGVHLFNSSNAFGCDSTTILVLSISSSTTEIIDHFVCDNYIWNGVEYTESGTYDYQTINSTGCDSVTILNLTIEDEISIDIDHIACDSYEWNGTEYTESGDYAYQSVSVQGCDSTAYLHLEINNSSSSFENYSVCDSFMWNSVTYFESGIYQYTTVNGAGCDSLAVIELTIDASTTSFIQITSCEEYFWNETLYEQSGIYQFETLNVSGCDSIATLELTIQAVTSSFVQLMACDSIIWNGTTYHESGLYTFDTINENGCDSTATMDLTVHKSNVISMTEFVCDSLDLMDNIYDEDGQYTIPMQNSFGCDSIIILDLFIVSDQINAEVNTCSSYTWELNGQTYEQSGIYTEQYTNSYGCDSTYQLNLSIHPDFYFQQEAEACSSYRWDANDQVILNTGLFEHALFTQNGCDSVYSVDVIIHPAYSFIDTIVTNDEYIWDINELTYSNSGLYQEMYSTSEGCDSNYTLLLTIDMDREVYYPNIISSGNGNEYFTFYGKSISMIESLKVYDKWGGLVADIRNIPPNNADLGWDGRLNNRNAQQGVYVWIATLRLTDGTSITKYGDLTIVK